jgi:hypothetical protein
MIAIVWLSALLLAQSSPAPPLAGWVAQSPQGSEYAHYVRQEGGGSESTIIASALVCDCQPGQEVALMESALQSYVGAVVHVNASDSACGEPAQSILVTGIANTAKKQLNLETIFFRKGNSLYILEYTFAYAAPLPAAETALRSLCPSAQT